MMQKRLQILIVLLLIVTVTGCATSSLNQAKQQYELALRAEYPLPYYKAALEELDAVLARDPNYYQAYAIKGLIYRNLEDYEQATENLDIAKRGSYGGKQQWVPVMMNLTYGDIFHARASDAIRAGDWGRGESYQKTSIEFFNNAINTSFDSLNMTSNGEEFGISMNALYVSAHGRWAAAQFQMATIASKTQSKERQDEILREAVNRLTAVVESHPDAANLRYYLAEGYRKQALTIRRTDPAESERLQGLATSQLRACAELGLPKDLRNQAAQLFSILSKGTEPDTEQRILGAPAR